MEQNISPINKTKTVISATTSHSSVRDIQDKCVAHSCLCSEELPIPYVHVM